MRRGCGSRLYWEDPGLSRLLLKGLAVEELVEFGDFELDGGDHGLDLRLPLGEAGVEGGGGVLQSLHSLPLRLPGSGEPHVPSLVLRRELGLELLQECLGLRIERKLDVGINGTRHLGESREVGSGTDNILAGTRVLVNVGAIGRDPALWDAPEVFRPERFLGSGVDVRGHDLQLLAFGSGRRMCPGISLGLKMVQLSLANLLHGFTWRLPSGISTEELSMEKFGLSVVRMLPLEVVAEPKLPAHLYAAPGLDEWQQICISIYIWM
ncbi:hypothetical protein EJB05_06540, partial [Eragrostis curvula]